MIMGSWSWKPPKKTTGKKTFITVYKRRRRRRVINEAMKEVEEDNNIWREDNLRRQMSRDGVYIVGKLKLNSTLK